MRTTEVALAERDIIAALGKGLAVIESFDEGHSVQSITDVARRTHLERATARRCLLTLARLGYATYDGKFFRLTPRVLKLGHSYLAATPLPRIVQPFLERLSTATGESASAAVLDGTEILYIARASIRRVMSMNLSPGARLPAYCTSMGRVLLAALPAPAALDALQRSERRALTPNTKTDLDELVAELAKVRSAGFALIDEELEIGLRSIAVPIRDSRRQVVAALNIGGQASLLTASRCAEFLPLMNETRDGIGEMLP
jgi:IclR family pca regulon transcriptional regulator